MKEISIILKNNLLVEEFTLLDRFSCCGRIWSLTQKPTPMSPHIVRSVELEYIFDIEAYTMFRVISNNVLIYWNTDYTRNLGIGDEYEISESMYIRPIGVAPLTDQSI